MFSIFKTDASVTFWNKFLFVFTRSLFLLEITLLALLTLSFSNCRFSFRINKESSALIYFLEISFSFLILTLALLRSASERNSCFISWEYTSIKESLEYNWSLKSVFSSFSSSCSSIKSSKSSLKAFFCSTFSIINSN